MKVVKKGRSVVDAFFEGHEDCHVLEEGDVIYNAMLNNVKLLLWQ